MRLINRRSKPKVKIAISLLLAVTGIIIGIYLFSDEPPAIIDKVIDRKPAVKTPTAPEFNKKLYSVDDPASPWVVVNKGRKLPSGYVPAGLRAPDIALRGSASDPGMKLREETAASLEAMSRAASGSGANLKLTSGYRSYNTQISVYNAEVKSYGQAQADKESARPGHSEHQTGLAADLEPSSGQCRLSQCFARTAEGIWLAAHAHEYGFIIRYPQGSESLTGYIYEPWHFRYVGAELAAEIIKSAQTLEQFFGLPTFSNYPANITRL